MAEKFTNYLYNNNNRPVGSGAEVTIIDKHNTQYRQANSICQIHSIYITQEYSGVSTNPEADAARVSLFIDSNGSKYMIANNVLVLPNSSFYIEKTITLTESQQLKLKNNGAEKTLHVVCSSVDIV